jgi:hypothetical protein
VRHKNAAERYKFSIDFVRKDIEKRGGTLLSSEYINGSTKIDIRCNKCFNIWHPVFASIRKGNWCPICAKAHLSELFRCSFDGVKEEIAIRGGTLLSTTYNNDRQKLDIRCGVCELIWTTDYQHLRRGHWCINCSASKKHTIGECNKWALSHGGECLSTEYISCKQNLVWKCSEGHIWNATFDNVCRGKWCPECNIGKTQRILKDILQNIFAGHKIEENYKGFNWLYNKKTKGKQEIDIWIPHIKLAVEYDGEQHFVPVEYFGGKDKFVLTKRRDKLKNKKMKSHKDDVNWFIRFGYKESKKFSESYIRRRLVEEGALNGGE